VKWIAIVSVYLTLALSVSSANGEPVPDAFGPSSEARCGNSSADQMVRRTWRAARSYLGAPSAAPVYYFTEDRFFSMETEGAPSGYRRIQIHGAAREALAGYRGCQERREARVFLLHELAHLYQLPWVWEGEYAEDQADEMIPEGCAQAFAQIVALEAFGWSRPDYEEGWSVYDSYAREARKKYSRAFLRQGQFGDNWSLDPRYIPY